MNRMVSQKERRTWSGRKVKLPESYGNYSSRSGRYMYVTTMYQDHEYGCHVCPSTAPTTRSRWPQS